MKKRLDIYYLPFFVTVVMHKRRNIFLSETACNIFLNILIQLRVRYGIRIYEFVLMPDHYHLIICPSKDGSISNTLRHLNGRFSREWNIRKNKSGQLIQHGFHDHIIRDQNDYNNKAAYIHHNPVQSGLVNEATDYPWSSAKARYLSLNEPIHLDNPDFL
ncbi:MAG: transposase [Candidatus Nomurabacteria bacterium]|nr:MAG: transposase [Candidatus Nomurabacteria bacterium]